MSNFGNKPADSTLESLGYITCTSWWCSKDYSTYEPTDEDLIFINYKEIQVFHKCATNPEITIITCKNSETYYVFDTPVEITNKIKFCKDKEEWKLGK